MQSWKSWTSSRSNPLRPVQGPQSCQWPTMQQVQHSCTQIWGWFNRYLTIPRNRVSRFGQFRSGSLEVTPHPTCHLCRFYDIMFTWYEVVWCCMVRVCFSSHWDGDARTPTSVAPRHHKVTDSQSVAIEVKRRTWCQSTTTWFFEGLISFGIPLQLLANKQSWADSISNRKGTDIDGGLLCLVLLVPIN